MRILGIECTATPVSCALIEDGKLKGEFFLNLKTTHSQTLLPMVEQVLKLSGLSIKDVDVIAATAGPGSFTGVRIGISAVKGLCFAESKPCVPVSVLESMAYNLVSQDCIVCACMDARCNQVYNALFEIKNGEITRICEDRALMIDEVLEDLVEINKNSPEKTIFAVGDGAELFYKTTADKGVPIKLPPEHLKLQRASSVCFVAEKKALANETVDPDTLLPVYLRLPQAERELKKKQELNSKGSI